MIYSSWDIECDSLDLWVTFHPFAKLKSKKKSEFRKNEKDCWNIIILHRCTKNHNQIMYGFYDMEWETKFFVISDHFLIFYHPPHLNNLENQNVEKMKKASGDTTIYQKLWLGDVQFLRYSVQQINEWIYGRKKWNVEVSASSKN